MTVVSVIRGTNAHLIAEAAKLWIKEDDLVMDVTFGRGLWWTEYKPARFIAHDLAIDGVNFCHLPEANESVDVIAFDPPYVCMGGRDTSGLPEFQDRYGLRDAPLTVDQLHRLNSDGLFECSRKLVPGGRILAKVADYVSSGKLVLGHHRLVHAATLCGLEQADEFVHYTGTRPQPPGRRQVHSRRVHSFLCVFERRATLREKSRAALRSDRVPGVAPAGDFLPTGESA